MTATQPANERPAGAWPAPSGRPGLPPLLGLPLALLLRLLPDAAVEPGAAVPVHLSGLQGVHCIHLFVAVRRHALCDTVVVLVRVFVLAISPDALVLPLPMGLGRRVLPRLRGGRHGHAAMGPGTIPGRPMCGLHRIGPRPWRRNRR